MAENEVSFRTLSLSAQEVKDLSHLLAHGWKSACMGAVGDGETADAIRMIALGERMFRLFGDEFETTVIS